MADGTSPIVPAAPSEAVTPGGINHLVINVRDIEESHRFWTEILGFKEVGRSSRRTMRFYSGDHDGQMNHHDIALCREPEPAEAAGRMADVRQPVAINHIAITLPNREAWLKQLAWLRQKGVKFDRRVNHGMTHSLYISDPNGYGVEVLYELPREVWGENIQARSTTPRTCRPKATKPLSTTPTTRFRREGACGGVGKPRAAGPGRLLLSPSLAGGGASHTGGTPAVRRPATDPDALYKSRAADLWPRAGDRPFVVVGEFYEWEQLPAA